MLAAKLKPQEKPLTDGADPYVKIYAGNLADVQKMRAETSCGMFMGNLNNFVESQETKPVVGNKSNGNGRWPVWTERENNLMHLDIKRHHASVTIEVWDSIDAKKDGYLGGHTIRLDKLFENRNEDTGIAHVQLFDKGGNTGHDAGLLRCKVHSNYGSEEHKKGRQVLTIQVLGAVGLLPDTEPICDITVYADWTQTKITTLAFFLYLLVGALYFRHFFNEHACGGVKCGGLYTAVGPTPDDADAGTAQNSSWEDAGGGGDCGDKVVSTTALPRTGGGYPGEGGAFLDALLFQCVTVFSVGYGNHPVNLAQSWEPGSAQEAAFHRVKQFQSVNIIVSVVMIGMLVGSIGDSVRASMRKHLHSNLHSITTKVTTTAAQVTKVMTPEQVAARQSRFWWAQIAAAMTCLIIIIAIGAVFYMEYEDMVFSDAIYFTVVTISTVGYGDIAPVTTGGKVFSCFYIPLSVAFTGM